MTCENVFSPHGIGEISGEMIESISISTTKLLYSRTSVLEHVAMAIYQVAIFVVFHRGCSRALQDGKSPHHTTPHRPSVTGHGPSRRQFTPTDRAGWTGRAGQTGTSDHVAQWAIGRGGGAISLPPIQTEMRTQQSRDKEGRGQNGLPCQQMMLTMIATGTK